MISQLEFTHPIFNNLNDSNIIDCTNNTIILCEDFSIQKYISDNISCMTSKDNECNEDEDPSLYYFSDDDQDESVSIFIHHMFTSIYYNSNKEQKLIVSIEIPFVLNAINPEDIWFANWNDDHKIELFPFVGYEDYNSDWEKGSMHLYHEILCGVYGNFGELY